MDPEQLPRTFIEPLYAGVSMWLLGIATFQTYMYYRKSRDSFLMKFLVGVIWLLSVTHEASFFATGYILAITSFGKDPNPNDKPLASLSLSAAAAIMLLSSAVINLLIQANSVYRLWMFAKDKKMLLVVLLFTLVRFIAGVIPSFKQFKVPTLQFLSQYRKLLAICWTSGAISDILVALNFCYHLHQRRTGFVGTSKLLDKLIAWFVATGVLSSLVMVATIVMFLLMESKNVIWITVVALNPRLLFISMLAYLNTRSHFRRMHTQTPSAYFDQNPTPTFSKTQSKFNLKDWYIRALNPILPGRDSASLIRPGSKSKPPVALQIHVVTETETSDNLDNSEANEIKRS